MKMIMKRIKMVFKDILNEYINIYEQPMAKYGTPILL